VSIMAPVSPTHGDRRVVNHALTHIQLPVSAQARAISGLFGYRFQRLLAVPTTPFDIDGHAHARSACSQEGAGADAPDAEPSATVVFPTRIDIEQRQGD
jgi:hypothetical protein